jgi:hypothetical protein
MGFHWWLEDYVADRESNAHAQARSPLGNCSISVTSAGSMKPG